MLVAVFAMLGAQARLPHIVCVGASITEGHGTSRYHDTSYPAFMLQKLGADNYTLNNLGASGHTMLKGAGEWSYWNNAKYQTALADNPDIVFIDLGGNDAKGQYFELYDQFVADAVEMIESFKTLPSHPRVIILTAIPGFSTEFKDINDANIAVYINPYIVEAARQTGIEVLDMHALMADQREHMPDLVHPDDEGSKRMGEFMADYILQYPVKPSDGVTVDGKPVEKYISTPVYNIDGK